MKPTSTRMIAHRVASNPCRSRHDQARPGIPRQTSHGLTADLPAAARLGLKFLDVDRQRVGRRSRAWRPGPRPSRPAGQAESGCRRPRQPRSSIPAKSPRIRRICAPPSATRAGGFRPSMTRCRSTPPEGTCETGDAGYIKQALSTLGCVPRRGAATASPLPLAWAPAIGTFTCLAYDEDATAITTTTRGNRPSGDDHLVPSDQRLGAEVPLTSGRY